MRILPFEFGKTTAKCCSRELDIDARVLNAFCTGSNRNTEESEPFVPLPLFPPTSKT
jgi:hypothetical protein